MIRDDGLGSALVGSQSAKERSHRPFALAFAQTLNSRAGKLLAKVRTEPNTAACQARALRIFARRSA